MRYQGKNTRGAKRRNHYSAASQKGTRNRRSQIAFSSILRRKDSELLNGKEKKVNDLLKEELELHGFYLIDNDNVLSSNIGAHGLHINLGGTRKFAGNLASYLRYC